MRRGALAATFGWAIGTKALALDEARATRALDVAAAVERMVLSFVV